MAVGPQVKKIFLLLSEIKVRELFTHLLKIIIIHSVIHLLFETILCSVQIFRFRYNYFINRIISIRLQYLKPFNCMQTND